MIEDELRKENYENTCFITMPIWKLVILTVLTFGLYEIVWFFKYWKTIKNANNEKISPLWRALFAGFSCFWLFPILAKYIAKHDVKAFSGVGMASAYFILNALYKAPDPFWLLSLLSLIPIIIIQTKINNINKTFYPNAGISKWTWKTTLFLVLYIIVFCALSFLYALFLLYTGQA